MKLQNVFGRILFIAAHVAVGFWLVSLSETFLSNKHANLDSLDPISSDQVRQICWSTDSKKLVSLVREEFGSGGSLVMHDLEGASKQVILDISRQAFVTAKLSPDGEHLLVAIDDGTLWWIETQSKKHKLLLNMPFPSTVTAADMSTDGKLVAAATSLGDVYLMDPDGQTDQIAPSLQVEEPKSLIGNIRFSMDGHLLVCAQRNGSISVWDLETGAARRCWSGHDQAATAIAVLPDDRIISAGLDATIRFWELNADFEISKNDSGLSAVTALAASEDGKLAAWGGYGKKVVIVWDIENSRMKYEIPVSASIVWDIQFSPDCKAIALSGNDGSLRLYDVQTGVQIEQLDVRERLEKTLNPC